MKTALVTGASSGIGRDIAVYLNEIGYKVILVSRDAKKLNELAKELNNAIVYPCDLSNKKEVYKLHEKFKDEEIEMLVNNAGLGLFGFFDQTDLDAELNIVDVNIIAYHILTKLFLKDFVRKDKGYILNVASTAGFFAGPYLATYYASKNYILKLTMAINEELKQQKSNVSISALCPGPVATNFNNVAGGNFHTKYASSENVARLGIKKTLERKMIIIPTFDMKLLVFATRFLPYRTVLKIAYAIQKNKMIN